MKKAILLLLALCLCFSLCACCLQHEWLDATCTEPKTCAKCGKTEGEALGHTWLDASCTEPKTCSVCGATEGEALGHQLSEAGYLSPAVCSVCGEAVGDPKPAFFTENGLSVAGKPANLSVNGVVANREKDPTQVELPATEIVFKSYTIEPSAREGYETIKLTFSGKMIPPPITQVFAVPAGALCDYYTGYMFSERSTEDDETVELFDSVTIDGTKYTVYYSKEIDWSAVGAWSAADNAYIIGYEVTYLIDKPVEYDGLVFFLTDETEWIPYDENNEIDSGVLEIEDPASYHFFRIGNI